ncbi:MAG: TlpA disulfide reductase family protein [Ginsengibacter sp.]
MIQKKIFSKMLASALMIALCPAITRAQKATFPKNITVKGTVQFISPQGPNKIWLFKDEMKGKAKAIDSATVTEQNKSFTFHIQQDHPGIYSIDALHWDNASFWSDANVNVNMRGYDTAKIHMKIPHYNFVEGSMDNNFINLFEQIEQLGYLRFVDEYNLEYYAKEHKATDSAWITYLNTKHRYDSLNADLKMRKEVLMKVYKNRPVLLYALRGNIGPDDKDKYDEVMQSLNNLTKRYPWLTEAKQAEQTIITNMAMAAKVQSGNPVPSISYPDPNGKMHGLETYKGKYLLIDFWASWCGPCRAAIPKVKELYSEYKNKGLDVLSISIDDDKGAWRKAMKEENMPWEQLLSPDKDKTMKQFQFSGIPTMYLIDPDGKIIKSYVGYSPETEAGIKLILKNKTMAPATTRKSIPMASF